MYLKSLLTNRFMACMIFISACHKKSTPSQPLFASVPRAFPVHTSIKEASGIAASILNPGHIWVHEDSGSPTQLWLLRTDGTLVKTIFIKGAVNTDWEDMALSKGPDASLNYIYLADIGDNNLVRSDCWVYRVAEPALAIDTIKTYEKIRFQYPSGSHDAEAIIVDDISKDIYILTKSDNPSQIYKLSYPQNTSTINQAVSVGHLNLGGITGAALSPDGKEIIIKTYSALYYLPRSAGETIEQSIKKTALSLSYQLEPQGEAVAFAADHSGFYTLSEKGFSSSVNLYFYKRN